MILHNRYKNSLIALLIALSLGSCTERMDINLDASATRCVIYGELTTDTTAHKVMISTTGQYFKNSPPEPVTGATVTITDGTDVFVLTEAPESPGTYLTAPTVYGVAGRTYTLNVTGVEFSGSSGIQSYQATSFLPDVVPSDSIRIQYISYYAWKAWEVQAFAKDPANVENFYMFRASVNGVLDTDSIANIIVHDDMFFDGKETKGIGVYYFDDDNPVNIGDEVELMTCGITRDYYKFILEAQTAIGPSIPLFSGPPANPRTNITNKGLGFFAAYSIKRAYAKIPEKN
jgi:hypothetical protein